MTPPVPVPPAPSRAGRNLPAAVGVGAALGALALASLFVDKRAFVVLAAAAMAIAIWELSGALAARGTRVPRVPVYVGMVAMLVAAYVGGAEELVVVYALTVLAVAVWRLGGDANGYAEDVTAGVLVTTYAPLLAGFAVLLTAQDDGAWRVFAFILTTVGSDIGGYAVGVVLGRHPMAPSVSPKKTWEGFAGSALFCVVAATAVVVLALDGPWWAGVALGAATVVTATLGDLGESMIKRDLGIKDMGAFLPGHGGLMDRLDSLLPTAPVAWLVLTLLVP